MQKLESFPISYPSGGLQMRSSTCVLVFVDPQWVLTSAFCVSEVGTYSIDAVGGEHNLVIPSANEQIRGVDFMVKHPNYTHGDASVGGMATPESNDLALLKLKRPM